MLETAFVNWAPRIVTQEAKCMTWAEQPRSSRLLREAGGELHDAALLSVATSTALGDFGNTGEDPSLAAAIAVLVISAASVFFLQFAFNSGSENQKQIRDLLLGITGLRALEEEGGTQATEVDRSRENDAHHHHEHIQDTARTSRDAEVQHVHAEVEQGNHEEKRHAVLEHAKSVVMSAVSSVGVAVFGTQLMEDQKKWWEPARDSITDAAATAVDSINDAVYALEEAAANSMVESDTRASEDGSPPLPAAIGMETANVMLTASMPAQDAAASITRAAGVREFMSEPDRVLLGALAKDGWEEVHDIVGSSNMADSTTAVDGLWLPLHAVRSGVAEHGAQPSVAHSGLDVHAAHHDLQRSDAKQGQPHRHHALAHRRSEHETLADTRHHHLMASAKTTLNACVCSVREAVLGSRPADDTDDWLAPARDSVAKAADTAATSITDAVSAANDAVYAFEAAAADTVTDLGSSDLAEHANPLPAAPGMQSANVTLHLPIDRQLAHAEIAGSSGVAAFMARRNDVIMEALGKDGWQVHVSNGAVSELVLPAVRQELPLGVVMVPPPRFRTIFRDAFKKSGNYQQRGQADMVLENGEGICKVQLGFPFNQTFTISVSGVARAYIGWEGDVVSISADVQAGLRLPKVPGLRSIMEVFVRSYLTESVLECSRSLAKEANLMDSPSSQHIRHEQLDALSV